MADQTETTAAIERLAEAVKALRASQPDDQQHAADPIAVFRGLFQRYLSAVTSTVAPAAPPAPVATPATIQPIQPAQGQPPATASPPPAAPSQPAPPALANVAVVAQLALISGQLQRLLQPQPGRTNNPVAAPGSPASTPTPPATQPAPSANVQQSQVSQQQLPLIAASMTLLNQHLQRFLQHPAFRTPGSAAPPTPAAAAQNVAHALASLPTIANLSGGVQQAARGGPPTPRPARPATRWQRWKGTKRGLKRAGSGVLQAVLGNRKAGMRSVGRGLVGAGRAAFGLKGAAAASSAGGKLGGLAAGAASAGAALVQFVRAAEAAGNQQLESMKKYAQNSAAMGMVFSQLEMSESFRNMRLGNRMAGSTRSLSETKQNLNKNTENLEAFLGDFWNGFHAVGLEMVNYILTPLDAIAGWVLGKDEVRTDNITAGQWLIEVQKDTAEARARGEEWFKREKFD